MVQLKVSKINLFCQRDIRRYSKRDIGRKIPNFIQCQEVEKWQWLIVSIWHLVEISEDVAVYAYENASNFKLEPICFWGNSIRFSEENVAELSDKFFHFQYATLGMFKWALNNYTMLKLLFNQHPPFCNVLKNVSRQYYPTNQDTKLNILL